jgi:undecaprenyl diphosphate synthase
MIELNADIYGRVQGVGLRRFIKREAEKLGLTGSVRNTPVGDVSVVAQGTRKNLDLFLVKLQQGSLLSKISEFSYSWRKPSKQYSSFDIVTNDGFLKDQSKSFINLGKNLLEGRAQIPRHVAIIPDGNRRWATAQGFKPWYGHRSGASYDKLVSLFRELQKRGVKCATFWAFSTENWGRDRRELNELFSLFRKGISQLRKELVRTGTRFRHLGRLDRLPKDIVKEIVSLEKATENFDNYYLQICFDYGGRDELVRAVNRVIGSGTKQVTEKDLARYLDTSDLPDVDLIIRTSGEKRTSGFMPFQSAYAELYFSDKYFPDFSPDDLRLALEEFAVRKRNFGK